VHSQVAPRAVREPGAGVGNYTKEAGSWCSLQSSMAGSQGQPEQSALAVQPLAPEQQQQQEQQEQQQEQPVWHGLVAGAVSGLTSRVVTYPADTIKARLQLQNVAATARRGAPLETGSAGRMTATHYAGTLDAARLMLLREGPPSLYRGFGAVLVGVVPANMAYFGGYELGRRLVPQSWGVGGDMATGAVAQLLAGVVYTPVDIIKERMQVQAIMGGAYKYTGPMHALRCLLAEGGGGGGWGGAAAAAASPAAHNGGNGGNGSSSNSSSSGRGQTVGSNNSSSSSNGGNGGNGGSGSSSAGAPGDQHQNNQHQPQPQQQQRGRAPLWRFSGIFRGYWATNAVWLPWNVIYIAAYERARQEAAAASGLQRPEQLPPWTTAACSAGAAAAAAVATHPGDVVKTRLQVLTGTREGRDLTAAAVARRIWAAEGARGFWSGLGARLLNIAPGCALSWALYEKVKGQLAATDGGAFPSVT
jgi:hypothetical protein